MKKNAVGRVIIHKETGGKRVSSMRLPARILCLFLAVITWLLIVNFNKATDADEKETSDKPETVETADPSVL